MNMLVLCLSLTCVRGTQLSEPTGARAVAEFQRIRGTSERVVYALQVGYAVSPTFKNLVDALEMRPVVVYVKDAPCLKGQPVACTMLAGNTAGVRYLHVHVKAKNPTRDLTVTLGHELQHALEIVGEPSVVDQRSFATLYRRIGRAKNLEPDVYETVAALGVAQAVRRELMAAGY